MKTLRLKGSKKIIVKLLTKGEPAISKIVNQLRLSDEEAEDLLEIQRPNIMFYNNFLVISMSFPNKRSLKVSDDFLQISFIMNDKEVIIITNYEELMINQFFDELKEFNFNNTTSVISYFINLIMENTMSIIDIIEEYLNRKEKEIVQGKGDKNLIVKMYNLKETTYSIQRTLIGNEEVIEELLNDKITYINKRFFSEHHKDRSLHFIDQIAYIREVINSNIESYIALMSHQLNKQIYKLTIIGSILIIPSVLSGLFGMNVKLPPLDFWQIIYLSVFLTIISYWLITRN